MPAIWDQASEGLAIPVRSFLEDHDPLRFAVPLSYQQQVRRSFSQPQSWSGRRPDGRTAEVHRVPCPNEASAGSTCRDRRRRRPEADRPGPSSATNGEDEEADRRPNGQRCWRSQPIKITAPGRANRAHWSSGSGSLRHYLSRLLRHSSRRGWLTSRAIPAARFAFGSGSAAATPLRPFPTGNWSALRHLGQRPRPVDEILPLSIRSRVDAGIVRAGASPVSAARCSVWQPARRFDQGRDSRATTPLEQVDHTRQLGARSGRTRSLARAPVIEGPVCSFGPIRNRPWLRRFIGDQPLPIHRRRGWLSTRPPSV